MLFAFGVTLAPFFEETGLSRLPSARALHRLRLDRRTVHGSPAAARSTERPSAVVARRHGRRLASLTSIPFALHARRHRPATPSARFCCSSASASSSAGCASAPAPSPPASWSTPATTSCSSRSCFSAPAASNTSTKCDQQLSAIRLNQRPSADSVRRQPSRFAIHSLCSH